MNQQSSIINHQSSIIKHQSSITNYPSSTKSKVVVEQISGRIVKFAEEFQGKCDREIMKWGMQKCSGGHGQKQVKVKSGT